MSCFVEAQAAPFQASYFVAEFIQREQQEILTRDLPAENLKFSTWGELSVLEQLPDFTETVRPAIKKDIQALRTMAHLVDSDYRSIIEHSLGLFEQRLFNLIDEALIPGGTAQGFRKVFYSELIVDFHELVQLIARTHPPTSIIKQIYIDLIESMCMCISAMQYVVREGMVKLTTPSAGQAQALTLLRERIVTAVIEEHVRCFVETQQLREGDSLHVVNCLKAKFANRYGISTPEDASLYLGYRFQYEIALASKLEQTLTVFNITNVIVDECYSALMQVLLKGDRLQTVGVIICTEPVLGTIEQTLASCGVSDLNPIMKALREPCHSPCILKKLMDWLSEELVRLKVPLQSVTDICGTLDEALESTGCIRQEEALRLSCISGEVNGQLMTAFKETGGAYVKTESLMVTVNNILSSDSKEYLLLSQLHHNLWVVIAGGLQATVVKTRPEQINIGGHNAGERKLFTFTHGVSYFWIEQGYDKRAVTVADICKIKFQGWSDDDIFRCFATALKSPFTIKEISSFLAENVLPWESERYISMLAKLINSDPVIYAPVLLLMDSGDIGSAWLEILVKNLDMAEPYLYFLEVKLKHTQARKDEIDFLLGEANSENSVVNVVTAMSSENYLKLLTVKLKQKAISNCEISFLVQKIPSRALIPGSIAEMSQVEHNSILYNIIKHDKADYFCRLVERGGAILSACIRLPVPHLNTTSRTTAEDDFPLLHAAVILNADCIVQTFRNLPAARQFVNKQSKCYGFSALHCAVYCENPLAVSILLEHSDFDVNLLTNRNVHALMMGIEMEKTEQRQRCVTLLFQSPKVIFDLRCRGGKTMRQLILKSSYEEEFKVSRPAVREFEEYGDEEYGVEDRDKYLVIEIGS